MGDVSSFDPPLVNDEPMPLPPAGTTAKAKASDVGVSAGWTNERHSTYISSMEASFVDQLYGLRKHAAAAGPGPAGATDSKAGFGRGELKVTVVREDLARDKKGGGLAGPNDARLPAVHTWVRRFRPHGQHGNSALDRRGGEEASVDDYGSGTDSVQRKVQTYGREAKDCACAEGNLISNKSKEVSDQNFPEEDVEADDEPCKRRRPTSTSAEPDDQLT